jgi:predicted phosphodiesterase
MSIENDNISALRNDPFATNNSTTLDTKYNIIAAGDWYCNQETQRTIDNIIHANPDLVITTGDHVRDVDSADCWIAMSKHLKDRMKIAIGNHDLEWQSIYQQIVNYHRLDNPYYSHNFQNIHFVSLSTEHPFEVGSKQYEFIKSDLDRTSKNSSVDWIIVHQHKAFYSTKQDKKEANDLRDTYQPMFQKYDVDLVLSGHNQFYSRTYPILYNKNDELINDKSDTPNPVVAIKNKHEYPPTTGIVFISVGTAGDKLNPIRETHQYHVIQQSKHGFLNLELSRDGKILTGEFYANDGEFVDYFRLHEN